MTRRQKDPLRALTEEERGALEQRSRAQSEPASHVVRAKVVLAVAAGQSYTAAARSVGRRSGDAVAKAISMMSKGGYRRLPIVDEQGRPKGIVTAEGIMRYLAEHIPTVIYNLPPEPHHATQEREGA